MDPYKETAETWNKIAQLYQEKFMDLDIYNGTYDFICETVTAQHPNILEIGCGPGNITKYLLSKRPDFKVLGIDNAPKMIQLAKTNNPDANFLVMDCRQILSIDKKFDAIICGFCLPYLSEVDSTKLISDCSKLLNNKGIFYLSFVEGKNTLSGFQTNSNGDRMHFNYHNLVKITSDLNASLFEPLKSFKINYKKGEGFDEIHTVVVVRKKDRIIT